MSLVRRSAALGVVLLAAACTTSTEGTASPAASSLPSSGGTVLDPGSVESTVAGQFEEREGVPLDLSCDRRMAVEVRAHYRCRGTTVDGEDIEILISITDDSGGYTWAED